MDIAKVKDLNKKYVVIKIYTNKIYFVRNGYSNDVRGDRIGHYYGGHIKMFDDKESAQKLADQKNSRRTRVKYSVASAGKYFVNEWEIKSLNRYLYGPKKYLPEITNNAVYLTKKNGLGTPLSEKMIEAISQYDKNVNSAKDRLQISIQKNKDNIVEAEKELIELHNMRTELENFDVKDFEKKYQTPAEKSAALLFRNDT